MDKLFRFSKVAAIIALISAVLLAFFRYSPTEWWNDYILFYLSNVIKIIEFTLIIVFYTLICKFSIKGSPLRTPSVIGIISVSIRIVFPILWILFGNTTYDFMGVVAYVEGTYVGYAYSIGIFISFAWLSKFLHKTSNQIVCIFYAVIPLLLQLYETIYYATTNFEERNYEIFSIIYTSVEVIGLLLLSAFLYNFSKILNK